MVFSSARTIRESYQTLRPHLQLTLRIAKPGSTKNSSWGRSPSIQYPIRSPRTLHLHPVYEAPAYAVRGLTSLRLGRRDITLMAFSVGSVLFPHSSSYRDLACWYDSPSYKTRLSFLTSNRCLLVAEMTYSRRVAFPSLTVYISLVSSINPLLLWPCEYKACVFKKFCDRREGFPLSDHPVSISSFTDLLACGL